MTHAFVSSALQMQKQLYTIIAKFTKLYKNNGIPTLQCSQRKRGTHRYCTLGFNRHSVSPAEFKLLWLKASNFTHSYDKSWEVFLATVPSQMVTEGLCLQQQYYWTWLIGRRVVLQGAGRNSVHLKDGHIYEPLEPLTKGVGQKYDIIRGGPTEQ
jgi:hypothetical protein